MARALLYIKNILRHIAYELSWRIPPEWKHGDSAMAPVARVSASFTRAVCASLPTGLWRPFFLSHRTVLYLSLTVTPLTGGDSPRARSRPIFLPVVSVVANICLDGGMCFTILSVAAGTYTLQTHPLSS